MSDDGQRIELSGVIHAGNMDQAAVIYLVLVALGWHGAAHMVIRDGDELTSRKLDTSAWKIEA